MEPFVLSQYAVGFIQGFAVGLSLYAVLDWLTDILHGGGGEPTSHG
jgi:hypothetical protein